MKLTTSLFALSLCTFVVSNAFDFINIGGQSIAKDDPKPDPINGSNPLVHCNADHKSDLLLLERVDLTPNPPTADTKLKIVAKGTLLEDVRKGAYVNLQVKYGLIKLVSMTQDLCDQVSNVDMECPVKKGLVKIVKEVKLPKEIPPGQYEVTADAYTKDDEKLICLKAHIKFEREL